MIIVHSHLNWNAVYNIIQFVEQKVDLQAWEISPFHGFNEVG